MLKALTAVQGADPSYLQEAARVRESRRGLWACLGAWPPQSPSLGIDTALEWRTSVRRSFLSSAGAARF